MAVSAVVGIIALAGGAYSATEQRKARKEQKQANERAARIEAVRSQRERAGAIRANRLTAAQVFAQSGNASTSTAVQGTLSSLGSQGASEFAFANQINMLNQERLGFIDRAEGRLTRAGYGQTVSQVASSIRTGG